MSVHLCGLTPILPELPIGERRLKRYVEVPSGKSVEVDFFGCAWMQAGVGRSWFGYILPYIEAVAPGLLTQRTVLIDDQLQVTAQGAKMLAEVFTAELQSGRTSAHFSDGNEPWEVEWRVGKISEIRDFLTVCGGYTVSL